MKITDDRGVERVVRVNIAKTKDTAFAGSLVPLHVVMVTLISATVFSLSWNGSRWVLEQCNVQDAAMPTALVGAVVFTVVAVAMYFRRVAISPPLVSREIDPRFCRVCGYDLEGLAIEPDGCRVCPECGAAWRVPRSGGKA